MSDISSDFGSLRVSALQKASRISSFIDKVTIGPDSISGEDASWAENVENEKNTCNLVAKDTACSTNGFNDLNMSTRSTITFSKKKILLENEYQRQEEVRRLVNQRKRNMEKIDRKMQEELAIMKQILMLQRENEEREALARLEAEEERLAQQNEMRRKHEQQLQAQRFQERKEKLERDAEEHRKTREREELVNRIAPLRLCFREKCRDITTLSKACKDRNSAASALTPLANKLKELSQQMESINERTRTGDITTTDVSIAANVVRQSDDVLNICKSEIARIDALFDEEIARREYEMRQAEAQAQAEAARLVEGGGLQPQNLQDHTPQSQEAAQHQQRSGDANNAAGNSQGLSPLCSSSPDERITNISGNVASPTDSSSIETTAEDNTDGGYLDYVSLQLFMNTHQFLNTYVKSYQDLSQATSLKKFRFECQKAINIPVNAIGSTNGSHLKDKYETLRSVLMGKSSPNVTQHPQGVAFCKDLLAKKIVSQGETLISSKPEMAFPVAAVAVALWNDYPDFGDLLIGHLRRACPYILPVFLPHIQGQTNEEYYKSLGYKYIEGKVEEQDKYVTRMSGLMRLYASIIVTRQRCGLNVPHPHGIQNAWRWLAAIMNAEPRPDLADVCATLILDMLYVAGNVLWQAYPRQFQKLLMTLATQFYPQMQSEGFGDGPMARLELFLKDCLTNKSISPPEGQLPPNFW